ncbi:hypothetical protein PC9H_008912 [Pleurotus ostreatus]|uniref:HNH nuclease domain-containing protein n=2 Tax=Pleurotus ostreatus TaxID=5322 RepID=A0A067NW48_PLEO1|nr:uncharacterized protein PC9H_008912 [Pleurotus ostreatus]KAF7426543.1 hypothetical protein PC9H_008912 [Pleurotus ostreatus]KDQ32293.1 hypothetical protein PLEOSDRAFT_1100782 [Pleurotus ostreatus PC15]
MSNLPLEAMPTSRSTRPRWRDNCVARVHSVCPHGAFCLLGNHAMANGVEYTQLVPRALSSNNKLMNKLERYWGMTRRTLNLDTRYNVFPCSSGLHVSHDASEWGLLPLDNIDGHFLYRFLPLRNMETATITRYLRVPTAEDPPLRPEDVVNHFFPFDSIPPLKSHIHPKFAIFELGLQVLHLPLDVYRSLLTTTPIISSVLDIYYAWTRTPPTRFLEDTVKDDESGGDDDDPNDEDWSEASTIQRRISKRKCKTPTPPSPSARPKRSRPMGGTLRAIRSCIPLSNPPLRIKEWVHGTQLALDAANSRKLLSNRRCLDGEKPTTKKRKIS